MKNGCTLLDGHRGSCDPFTTKPLDNLPEEILKKIEKTSMTRGAQPYGRVPYQNRVRRWNRVVIPFAFRESRPVQGFENGFIIMVRPDEYFDIATQQRRDNFPQNIIIGENAFMYYDNRVSWKTYPPTRYGWIPREYPGNRRESSSVETGHYMARVPATTAAREVIKGDPMGIRFFEYASRHETWKTMMQLGYLAWKTNGIENHATGQMTEHLRVVLSHFNLADENNFQNLRVMNNGLACCPLCRDTIQAAELIDRVAQAPGREIFDLTITEANLFHLRDLVPGEYNHTVYGLGWGHHHCNSAARDIGIDETLNWMEDILIREGRVKKIND